MPMAARGHFVDSSFEYFYSLLCRSLIYAAGREPAAKADWETAAADWRVKDAQGNTEKSGKGRLPKFSNLSSRPPLYRAAKRFRLEYLGARRGAAGSGRRSASIGENTCRRADGRGQVAIDEAGANRNHRRTEPRHRPRREASEKLQAAAGPSADALGIRARHLRHRDRADSGSVRRLLSRVDRLRGPDAVVRAEDVPALDSRR